MWNSESYYFINVKYKLTNVSEIELFLVLRISEDEENNLLRKATWRWRKLTIFYYDICWNRSKIFQNPFQSLIDLLSTWNKITSFIFWNFKLFALHQLYSNDLISACYVKFMSNCNVLNYNVMIWNAINVFEYCFANDS